MEVLQSASHAVSLSLRVVFLALFFSPLDGAKVGAKRLQWSFFFFLLTAEGGAVDESTVLTWGVFGGGGMGRGCGGGLSRR